MKARSLFAAASAIAAFSALSPARAEEPLPVPVRYPPSSVRPKIIVGGIAVAGIAYGAVFLGAEASATWPGAAETKIPVVGPWIGLGKNACPPDNPGCDALIYLRAGLLVIDGLLQAAGLAIVAEGILMKTEAAAPPPKPLAGFLSTGYSSASAYPSFTLRPAPFVTPTSGGFGFVGTF